MTFQQWVEYANTCIKPGLQYFLDKFSQELSGSVAAFKAARLFLPQKVVELYEQSVSRYSESTCTSICSF